MHVVTSFSAARVEPEQLGSVMAEYIVLERARMRRRLLTMRCGLLALAFAAIGLGFHWMPRVLAWVSVGACAVAPVWAWVGELRSDFRLARKLDALPGGATHVLGAEPRKKVVKSS